MMPPGMMPPPMPQQPQGINTGMDPVMLEKLMRMQQAPPPMPNQNPNIDPRYQSNLLRPEPTQQLPGGRPLPLPINTLEPQQSSPLRDAYRPLMGR